MYAEIEVCKRIDSHLDFPVLVLEMVVDEEAAVLETATHEETIAHVLEIAMDDEATILEIAMHEEANALVLEIATNEEANAPTLEIATDEEATVPVTEIAMEEELYNLKYDYKAVRRWTTQKKIGYSLNDCDKIFVPIHKEIHWCLAIIDMRAKKFQYLDSLNGTDGHVLQVLARYIADEVKDKTGQELDVSTWEQEIVEDIPGQENGWDCGMFMIKYADFHSRDLPLIFGQEHMPYFRKRTAKEILRLRAE